MTRADTRRAALVDLLAAGQTHQQAAAVLGVSRATVSRRLAADPSIRDDAETIRADLLEATASRLLAAAPAVAVRLVALTDSGNDQTALGACRTVLEQATRLREVTVLEQRVAEIEAWRAEGLRALPTYDSSAGRWRTG